MYTLGIDIGSATSKCAILYDGDRIIATSLKTGGLGTEGPQEAVSALWMETGLSPEQMARTIVTGYGRKNYLGADGDASELSCHALGGRLIFPDLRTLIDIGGQDAKIISLDENGRMVQFIMNDKCAAGTGRFLEVMACILRMDVDELGACASKAENPVSVSSTCTVFAESEVISQLASGADKADLVSGICNSVAARVSSLARRLGIIPRVCMSGGVAQNAAVRHELEKNLGVQIGYDALAQYFGAIGAAIWAWKQVAKQK